MASERDPVPRLARYAHLVAGAHRRIDWYDPLRGETCSFSAPNDSLDMTNDWLGTPNDSLDALPDCLVAWGVRVGIAEQLAGRRAGLAARPTGFGERRDRPATWPI